MPYPDDQLVKLGAACARWLDAEEDSPDEDDAYREMFERHDEMQGVRS